MYLYQVFFAFFFNSVCAFLSPFTFVPGRRGEKAYKVEKHVNKASKTMNEHGERLMEYKKAINETLTQGKEQLKKLWNENKDHWSSKAEAVCESLKRINMSRYQRPCFFLSYHPSLISIVKGAILPSCFETFNVAVATSSRQSFTSIHRGRSIKSMILMASHFD